MTRIMPLVVTMWASTALAVPVQWQLSSRVADAAGAPIHGTVAMTVSLYTSEADPSADWSASFSDVEVSSGYFTVELGTDVGGNPLQQSLLASGELWLGITVGGPGSAELLPRQRILSTPYARRAEVAEGVVVGSTGAVACTTPGQLLFDGAATLYACNGSEWVTVGGTGIILQGGSRRFADGTVAKSCEEYIRPSNAGYRYAGSTGDGLYRIDPDGPTGTAAVDVWCDMSTDDGGWTLVSSVVSQGPFWSISTYSAATGARAQTLGSPSLDSNYVLHLETWRDLLAARGSASELRLRVRRVDNGQDATLGRLVGLQMATTGQFNANPTAAFKGDGTAVSPATGACVIAYQSDFTGVITAASFNTGDAGCAGGHLGWNGSCGHTSMGHNGAYIDSGTDRFTHSCSLDLEYYCSANRTTGPTSGGTLCHYFRKWYFIR